MSFDKTIPLNEYITLQRGFDLPKKDRADGVVPVVASTGIGGYHNKAKVKAPGVVIGRSGSIGGGQYITEDFWPLNTTLWVKDFKNHHPRYVYYLLRSIDFTHFNVGSGVPTLNRNHLSSILVADIGYKNEERIAKIIGDLDDKIKLNTQTNQTLEQIAQAIFKSWFVDFEPVKAKMAVLEAGGTAEQAELAAMSVISGKDEATLKQLQAEHPDRYQELAETAALFPSAMVESELGEIPAGWSQGALSDIASFAVDRIPVSKITIENYISTENMLENKRGIGVAATLPSSKTVPLFERGHILVSNIRPYFKKIWFARFDGGRSPDVLGFVSNDSGSQEFLYNFLYQDKFFDFMMTTSKGAKMPRGDKDAIMEYKIVLPPQLIQRTYSSLVRSFYEEIESLCIENKFLGNIRDTLLPKLLSGEIDLIQLQAAAEQEGK